MTDDDARQTLRAAASELQTARATYERARERMYEVIRSVQDTGVKQVEIVNATGWTREHIRKIARGDAS